MDEILRDKLLHSFPHTVCKGIIREFDAGRSRSPVLAVRFYAQDPHGLNGTYIVKIGPESWAANEQAFYAHSSTGALAPLLAAFQMCSQTIEDMIAVAYDVAFGSLIQPQPLMGILDEGSQGESETRQQIRDLSQALVNWYLASDISRSSTVSDPYSLLYRMLGQRRMDDILGKLRAYLPFWEQDALQIGVEGLDTRLPNPIAYIRKEAWSKIRYNPHSPLGRIHGDLHTGNIICPLDAKTVPKVIDFGQSVPDGVPFFDLAYLEFDIMQHVLPVEQIDNREQWLSLLNVSMANVVSNQQPRHGWQAARAWKLIQPIRQQVKRLQEVDPESFEIVWWLATVAVGLNFARKGREERLFERMSALLYAAYGLNRLLALLHIDGLMGDYIPVVRWLQGPPQSALPQTPRPPDYPRPKEEVGNTHHDWGRAPDVPVFFGRTEELTTLEQWIARDHFRLVAIVGIAGIGKTGLSVKLGKGGIGKTDLSLRLARGIQDQFEYVVWRSLFNAPTIAEVLTDLIKFLSNQQDVDLPDTVDGQISRLLHYLHQHRCLLILDNVAAILQGGEHAGRYRTNYEEYGHLFRQVAEVPHQSCLLLTSREKPPEIARLEGKIHSVRSLELGGMDYVNSQKIFAAIGSFSGSEEEWRQLNDFYNGNPLALELAAKHIRDVFFGNISEFLKEGKPVFADLRELLDWHFERLSDAQKEVMYWLAINREPVSLSELKEDILSPATKKQLPSTLQQLQRLLPLEKSTNGFTLQPVLMEYLTDRLVEHVVEEIISGKIALSNSHALLKALAKDYVRESQSRVVLTPIADQLLFTPGKEESEQKLKRILDAQRKIPGYATGNVLNLFAHFETDLRGYDFSHLTIWQADLRGLVLVDVNFTYADFARSVFTETFGIIISVAFSPDGELLAAGTANSEIRLWQATSGTPLRSFQPHPTWVWSVAFSPDGKVLASSSDDQTIRLWEVSTGKCLNILHGHTSWVRSVAFSPDGQLLASGSEDQTIRIWVPGTGECLKMLQGHAKSVRSVAFSPDGSMLASGSEDATVCLWEVNTSKCLQSLHGHTSWVRSVAFSPDGRFLASGSDDKTIRLWEASTGECLKTLQGHTNWVFSVAFSPDGKTIASGGEDQTVRLWEVDSGECLKTLVGHTHRIRSVAFSPDGTIVASGSENQTVRLWEVSTGGCLKTLHGHTNEIWAVAFSFDGKTIACGSEDRTVRLSEISTGKNLKILGGHADRVRSVSFSPDGRLLASGSEDQTIRIWDAVTGECLKSLYGHTNRIWSVSFSADGRVLASGSEDATVRLWEVSTGESLKVLREHTNRVRSVAFSSESNLLISGSDDKTVRVWDASTGECLKTLQGHTGQVWAVAFGHETVLASGSEDQTLRVWDANTGECLKILQGHTSRVRSVAFGPDGKVLVSGSDDQTVCVWEASSGECLKTLQGHTGQIWAVAFSPMGDILASGSNDETIRLWDVQTGNCPKTLRSERPYERMNIAHARGLTEAQKITLKVLGAIEKLGSNE